MIEDEVDEFINRLLTCSICFGVFDDPVTLQCGHTYCRTCLTSYIKNNRDAIRDKVIPCSVHCTGTKVPDPQKPADTWASQLSPSFIIVNIMYEFKQKIGGDCSICNLSKKASLAVKLCRTCDQSLCKGCSSSHRRNQTTRLHTLTDLPSIAQNHTQQYPRCEDHRDEFVKLICEDCNQAICNTCCSLQHRQCKSVVLVETKQEQIKTNVLFKKSNRDTKIENTKLNIAYFMSSVDEIRQKKSKLKSEIKETFQKNINIIKSKESSLLNQLEDITDKEIENLEDKIKTAKNDLQLHQQHIHFIDKAVEAGFLIDMYKMCQTYLSSETDNAESTHREVTDVRFSVNIDQLLAKINKLDFGKLSVSHETDLATTVECRLPSDMNIPSLHDLTVLDVAGVQTIVVTDYTNNCVKSIYTNHNTVQHRRLVLSDKPWGLTRLDENRVMVAVPNSCQIVTVAVTSDLVLMTSITTNRDYFSLAVLGPTSLAAGGKGCVDILNMEGRVMKSVTAENNVELYAWPYYMCVNKGQLLVSDCLRETVTCLTVTCLTSDMIDVWRKGGLTNPQGISTTSRGNILVADSDLKKVIQLTESGHFVRDVLTSQNGLARPWGICVDKHNSLFVCDGDKVKCFKFTDPTQMV